MSKTAILILAAGASKRMGEPKQLLPYNNTTLLLHSIKQVIDIKHSEVFIVVGAYFTAILNAIRGQKVTIIRNSKWEQGMGSSLSKGIELIKKKNQYNSVLITLGDLPLLTSEHYQALIALSASSKKRIVVTNYSKVSGVPTIFHRSLFSELSALSNDEGAGSLIIKYKKETIEMTSEAPFLDVDTKEAYQKLLKLP